MNRVALSAFFISLLVLAGCKKGTQNGEIYGTVSDRGFDGKPVPVVNLVLSPGGKSTVTGSDGRYVFRDINPGDNYIIHYSKQGYVEGDTGPVSVAPGTRTQVDIQIEMVMQGLAIDKEELDFGADVQNNIMSFDMQNKYTGELDYKIINNCGWINMVSPSEGTMPYGQVASVVVGIDRSLLMAGDNFCTLVIVAEDIGSYGMRVKAKKVTDHLASLNVLSPTSINATTAVLNARILDEGFPRFSKRGFIISESSSPTEENSREVSSIVSDALDFSSGVDGLVLGNSYYVKAFSENSVGRAYSSNTVKFTTSASAPVVETMEPTSIDVETGTVVFRGKVIEAGDPPYNECGFAYSNVYQYPTVDDNSVVVDKAAGLGVYEKRIHLQGELYTYYFRAYAKNELGQVSYGEPVKIKTPEYYDIPAAKLSVQTRDIGRGDWVSMNNLCNNSAAGGFTDWRLPTLSELGTVYEWRNTIGGFHTTSGSEYWTSTQVGTGYYYYYIYFDSGNYDSYYPNNYRYARCVRGL